MGVGVGVEVGVGVVVGVAVGVDVRVGTDVGIEVGVGLTGAQPETSPMTITAITHRGISRLRYRLAIVQHMRRVSGSTSTVCSLPLTVMDIEAIYSLLLNRLQEFVVGIRCATMRGHKRQPDRLWSGASNSE